MLENNYYAAEYRLNFAALMAGNCCAWPRQPYHPADLLPHQHETIRAAFYRAARRDELDEEAAEEAASWSYCYWLARDYAKNEIGRGDHLRAYASIRKYGKLTQWKGVTGHRRQKTRKTTQGMIERKERTRQAHQPRPDSFASALDRIAHNSRLMAKVAELMAANDCETVDDLLRMASGLRADGEAQLAAYIMEQATTGKPADPRDYRAELDRMRENGIPTNWRARRPRPDGLIGVEDLPGLHGIQ